MAETNSLLNCRTGNCTAGSNPAPTATKWRRKDENQRVRPERSESTVGNPAPTAKKVGGAKKEQLELLQSQPLKIKKQSSQKRLALIKIQGESFGA